MAGVGVLAGALVALGNPGHMGLCGACFLRDVAGALRLHAGPALLRPEVPGLMLGALLWSLRARRHVGRSGSHAVVRFVLCVVMGIGALVFLGCPFRLLQRLGGGDLHAWLALPGFVGGVGVARWFERRGWSLGRTAEVPAAIGVLGPLATLTLLALSLAGGRIVGPGDAGAAPHAPWPAALLLALIAGALLSATGFCAISAARAVFGGPRTMLAGALAVVLGYGATAVATGGFTPGWTAPVAHGDLVVNTLALALALVGLCGALAGGCPVRQLVMAGEGNGDAFVGVAGLVVGGALAHSLQLASTASGPTDGGRLCVVVLLPLVGGFAALLARTAGRANTAAPIP